MTGNKVFLKECYIQHTSRYDALEVWDEIGIGTKLHLRYEDDNANGTKEKKVFIVSKEHTIKENQIINIEEDGKINHKINLVDKEVVLHGEKRKVTGSITVDGSIAVDGNPKLGGKVKLNLIAKVLEPKAKSQENEPYNRIGILSEEDSKDMMEYFAAEWETRFEAIVSYKDEKADEDKRLKVAIYILKQDKV